MRASVTGRRLRRLLGLSIGAAAAFSLSIGIGQPAFAAERAATSFLPLHVGGLFGFGGGGEKTKDAPPPIDTKPAAKPTPHGPVNPLAFLAAFGPRAGEWSRVPGVEFDRFRLSDAEANRLGVRGAAGSASVLTNKTGSAFDPDTLLWYFWGGGGSAYAGNEVYRLDLSTASMVPVNAPSVLDTSVNGAAGQGCQIPSDAPASASTSDGMVWSPSTQSFFVFPAARYCANDTLGPDAVWEFDPFGGLWTKTASMANVGAPVFAEYDPATDKIVVVASGDNATIREFDPVTGQFSPAVALNRKLTSGTAVLDPGGNRLIVFSQEGVFGVSLVNFGTTQLLSVLPNGFDPASGAVFDSNRGLVVLWAGGPEVRTFDPATAEWAKLAAPSGPAPAGNGVFSKWILIEQLGLFAGYQNPAEGLWLYRLPASIGGSGPANSAPVADAGATQRNVRTGRVVNLSGLASFDPDGDRLTYSWSLVSAPQGGNAAVSGNNGPTASFTPSVNGAYVIRLTVNDGSLSDSHTVTVNAGNGAPIADAGPNASANVGVSYSLVGSGSSDPDGDTLTYSWSILSKPADSTSTLSSATVASPSLMLDVVGAFVLQLIVSDGTLTGGPDTVQITSTSLAPAGGGSGGGSGGPTGNIVHLNPGGSFEDAVESLRPGDTLVVHQGTYADSGRISIGVKGTSTAPVVIMGAQGEARPLITRTSSVSVQNTINVEGATYLTIKGLEITGNGGDAVNMSGGPSNITLEDLVIHHVDVGINFRSNMSGIVARGNNIYNTGIGGGTGEGMYVGCNNAACVVTNSVIENNWIHDNLPGTSQGDGIEIKPGSHSNIVRNNVIHDMNYPCVLVYGGGAGTNLVEGNVLWNCNEAIQAVSDAVIQNNVVFNSHTGITAAPHIQVADVNNVSIVNNTFYGHANECLYIRWTGATNNVLANNAVYCPSSHAVNAQGLSGAGVTVSANYVQGAMSGASVDGAGFVSGGNAASQFVNPAGFDFWPTGSSVLADTADPGFKPAADFNGSPRTSPHDVGAYEAAGSATNPGWHVQSGFKGGAPSSGGGSSGGGSSGGGSSANVAPVADAGNVQSLNVGQTATLNGNSSFDSDGDPLTYAWTLVSKPAGSQAGVTNATSATPRVTLDVVGDYIVQLVVNDGKQASAPHTVMLIAQAVSQPPVVGGGGNSSLSQLAASMQPGTWSQLNTSGIGILTATNGGNIIEYTDEASWDPISRRLYIMGGSHHGSYIDKFVAYSEATNSWSELSKPFSNGQIIHTYDHQALNPSTGKFYFRPYNSRVVSEYDTRTGAWTTLPQAPLGYIWCCSGLEYFPELNGLVLSHHNELFLFNFTTRQWTLLRNDVIGGKIHNFTEYSPVHKVLVLGGGIATPNILYRLDRQGSLARMKDTPVSLNISGTIFTVDPVSGDFLVIDPSRNFYEYNPSTDTWRKLGVAPSAFAQTQVVASPIAEYGVTMFVTTSGAYLYKHSAGSGTPPPAPGPAPTPTPTPTVTLGANPTAITAGQSVALTWSSTNATSCTASGGWSGTKGPSGSQNVTPSVNTSYTLACGSSGTQSSNSVSVTVTQATPPAPTPTPTPAPTPPQTASGVGGFAMPSLQDEKDTYASWGWTWSAGQEPDFAGDPNYSVVNPDVHGATEGDDLWTYLMMYLRTGEQGYLHRAAAWKDYFLNATASSSFKFDEDAFGSDHIYGWGLVAWYEYTGDLAALAAAENLAAVVENLWSPTSTFACYRNGGCTVYGLRAIGRHLHLVTRVAEATGKQRWIDLRDKILNSLMNNEHWDAQMGTYSYGASVIDPGLGAGSYASGDRIVSAFQVGVVIEALAQVYRVTGRQDVKDRIVAIARFVDKYGLDPTYQYSGNDFGVVDGAIWHKYSRSQPVTFWDPVYTTSLVNTLVWGYKLTGEQHLLDKARYHLNRGTKGVYGSTTARAAADNVVGHFVDTKFDSSWGYFFLSYNKGELQYTYMIFENGGLPEVLQTPVN